MKFSEIFIRRPVATVLITIAIILAGFVAYHFLPVSPLPQVDFPTIRVRARLPGASPETMASTVATPLERSLGKIAGITEITSASTNGMTDITLQFDLDRNIDGAARDVQAAINASRSLLPTSMPDMPTYRKLNPADAPIMILYLTSESLTRAQMYDNADTVLAQKLMQIEGVGDVFVAGGSQPAVRVTMNPVMLSKYGLSMEMVRKLIQDSNTHKPKGFLDDGSNRITVEANDMISKAKDAKPLVVFHQNGSTVQLSDIADVEDGVRYQRNIGVMNGEPCIMLIIFREPGANIIETVDRIYSEMPSLEAAAPASVHMGVIMERTPTIRASLFDVQLTLFVSVGLVILVVLLFLRNFAATAISAITMPVSLIGTFSVMYLAGFSINNLSLMALTIATGFVVDDTIVVLENIMRHMEEGMSGFDAALKGAREVGFTVMSISISLIAVFIPIILMGGIIGRLFREFAVTLSFTILVSLFVSLTTTPMLCALWLKQKKKKQADGPAGSAGKTEPPASHNAPSQAPEDGMPAVPGGRFIAAMGRFYARTLAWAIEHKRLMLLILVTTIGFNFYLYTVVPKGFFPQVDTGRMFGVVQADQNISFNAMKSKLTRYVDIIKQHPAVDGVTAYVSHTQSNTARMFVSLKPLSERKARADAVMKDLRELLKDEPGASMYLQVIQDIRMGGRPANALYQFTLQSSDLDELNEWTPKAFAAMKALPMISDVNTDQEIKGGQTWVTFNRDAMGQLGVSQQQIDDALYDAFGQRQIATIYNELNQYKVVIDAPSQFTIGPASLEHIFIQSKDHGPIPLSALAVWKPQSTALSVNHQGQFAAATISFNLMPGVALSDATKAIDHALGDIGMPSSILGSYQGTAKSFKDSMQNQLILIVLALVTVYIVLGMLYESFVHPVTILSTLPSAGVGAILALIIAGKDFSVMSLIGVLLLIGIVKKNAIMMIDFAITARKERGLSPEKAIYEACLMRFRPIMMTTAAALFGALPLAFGTGDGAEMRVPLGISIVGGLILSQLLTLYTTPVVYLYMNRFEREPEKLPAETGSGETDESPAQAK